jgi:hypothetical protein
MPALFILSSCLTTQPIHPVAALLEQPSTQSRLVLENAIGKLLNSHPIKLADNAFTLKSVVIIEPNQPQDSQGNLLDGRDTRQAETFSLLIADEECYLKHEQSGQIKQLSNIHCKAK